MLIAIQVASDKPLIDHNYLIVTGTRRINALFQPTHVCPEIAPPGKHLLVAGAAPVATSPPFDPKAELDLCFQDLRDILPGFESHAEVLMFATFHGEWPAMHAWPGDDMPLKTPIVNLYNVGDGVKSPGMIALPAVAESAHRVVQDIKKRLSPAV
jgi:phytoene dehydrogenase-like protein